MDIIITIIVVLGILGYLYISKNNCSSSSSLNSKYQIYINLILWLIPSIGLYFIIRPLTLYKINVKAEKNNSNN